VRFWLVVPAAGIGSRMASTVPKQYLQVAGKTILEYSMQPFLQHAGLRKAVVAISRDDGYWPHLPLATDERVVQVAGGRERADSVLSALLALPGLGAVADDWVLVHDAARPWLQETDLQRLLTTLEHDAVGGLLACPVRDTLKQADQQQRCQATVPRNLIWHALTPQMFRVGHLSTALLQALQAGAVITDESSAMEWAGLAPRLVTGRSDNFKVTYPEDLQLLAALLAAAGNAN